MHGRGPSRTLTSRRRFASGDGTRTRLQECSTTSLLDGVDRGLSSRHPRGLRNGGWRADLRAAQESRMQRRQCVRSRLHGRGATSRTSHVYLNSLSDSFVWAGTISRQDRWPTSEEIADIGRWRGQGAPTFHVHWWQDKTVFISGHMTHSQEFEEHYAPRLRTSSPRGPQSSWAMPAAQTPWRSATSKRRATRTSSSTTCSPRLVSTPTSHGRRLRVRPRARRGHDKGLLIRHRLGAPWTREERHRQEPRAPRAVHQQRDG